MKRAKIYFRGNLIAFINYDVFEKGNDFFYFCNKIEESDFTDVIAIFTLDHSIEFIINK